MVRHLLQDFKNVSDYFTTLRSKELKAPLDASLQVDAFQLDQTYCY